MSQQASTAAAPSTAADFLKDLPSHNSANFSKFTPESAQKNVSRSKKSALYKIARSCPTEKVIVTSERPLILRYIECRLSQRAHKSTSSRTPSKQKSPGKAKSSNDNIKPEVQSDSDDDEQESGDRQTGSSSSSSRGGPPRKMPRTT